MLVRQIAPVPATVLALVRLTVFVDGLKTAVRDAAMLPGIGIGRIGHDHCRQIGGDIRVPVQPLAQTDHGRPQDQNRYY